MGREHDLESSADDLHTTTTFRIGEWVKILLNKRAPGLNDLDYVVAQLRALQGMPGITRTLAIGKLLLAQLFDGDPKEWRDRRKNKRHSLRALAQRRNCPFSKSTLSQAISTYVTVLELSRSNAFEHASASHFALLSRLPPPERLTMIEQVERGKWSVRYLREQLAARRAPLEAN